MAEWSAPVDRWVRRATGRDGRVLGGTVRLGLDDLWSKADAPSKRGDGHAFVRGHWITNAGLAESLMCTERNAEKIISKLRDEGLIQRGTKMVDGRLESGVWLADEPTAGRFEPEQTDGPARTNGRASPNKRTGTRTNGRAPEPEQTDGHHPNKRTGV